MKKLRNFQGIVFMALSALFVLSCDNNNDNPMPMPQQVNIVQTAQNAESLSSLVAALSKADESPNNDLITALSDENGSFTVLAPSNEAFTDLLSRLDGFNSLDDFNTPELQDLLATILKYHVIAGAAVASGDLTQGQEITTLGGEKITVSLENGVSFEDAAGEFANVTSANIATSNGIVHIIDKVLLPQEAIDALNGTLLFSITDLAISNPNLSSLVAALLAADGDLPTVLQGPGPFTVLAPTNEAFDAFLNGASLSDIPKEVLTQVLLNHVISGSIASETLIAAGSGYTSTLADGPIADSKLSIYYNTEDGVEFNGVSKVITPDVKALNGIVHVVDAVIGLPNIVDHALANGQLSELVGALTANGNTTFTDLLSSTDTNFTVFAPINSAFTAFTNPDGNELNTILANHVIAGSAALSGGLMNMYVNSAATNADGDALSLYINTDDGVTLNGTSHVVIADIVATNGIIHAVDAVIDLPKVTTFATADPTFATLVAALTAYPSFTYVNALQTPNGSSPAPFTVFAPTNEAFTTLLTDLGLTGLSEIPEGTLASVLELHVIAGANVRAEDLEGLDGANVTTLGGQDIVIDAGTPAVIGPDAVSNPIVATNVQAMNGVIHAISRVIR